MLEEKVAWLRLVEQRIHDAVDLNDIKAILSDAVRRELQNCADERSSIEAWLPQRGAGTR